MDLAAGLEGDSPVAVKFQLVFPAVTFIGEGVCPQEQHRIDEAALHFGSHYSSLADGSFQAPSGRIKSEYATIQAVPLRICAVSFADGRGIRHTVEVQAESLFEAAILGVHTFRGDPWIEHVGPAMVLDIEVREPAAKHAITMMQVERWLEGASTSPNEGVKKAKLRDLLGSH
jgi:hypothetical protein